jgi:hypothetical protein
VKKGVRIFSSENHGVDGNGNQFILDNHGTILSTVLDGVFFDCLWGLSQLVNESSGVIRGISGVLDEGGRTDYISNNGGHIIGTVTGILIGGNSQGIQLDNGGISPYYNYGGTIFGAQFGIQDYSNNHGSNILNNSNIKSNHIGIDICTNTGLVTKFNNDYHGVISGHDYAIRTHDVGSLSLNNYGTVNGNIYCDVPTGADIIHNHGKIHGTLELYSASDLFNGRGGTSGAIFCGAGNDRVIAGVAVALDGALGGLALVRPETSMSISRSAAKLIISRKRSASGVFSIKAFRFEVSSVIDGFLESGW